MSKESVAFAVDPDTEGILSVKKELERRACKDTVLLSNLDYSESVFRHNPLNKAVTLEVKGQWHCLRIGKNSDSIYTVSPDDGRHRIDCCIYSYFEKLEKSDIQSIHFSVHSCQDEIKSCFTAATETVKSQPQVLKITCNRFAITYITNGNHNQITTIETKCRFNLQRMTAEALLERKCWMEREKSKSDELIGCLKYLIEKYLTTPNAPKSNCRFILQGNKEMAEIICSLTCPSDVPRKEYIIMMQEHSKVCMYPPLQ